jgi:hypothetical protein
LGKKALRQQLGSPVGEGLLPLPTANGEAVGEADGVGTVWPRRGFANSPALPSVIGFWAVGEDFFHDSRIFLLGKSSIANSSGLGCWEISGLLAKPQFPVVHSIRCRFPGSPQEEEEEYFQSHNFAYFLFRAIFFLYGTGF